MDNSHNTSKAPMAHVFLPFRPGPSSVNVRTSPSPTSWPKTIDLLPDSQLKALVHHHEMRSMVSGKLSCWTYISQGLDKLGQKEVIFTIRRRTSTEAIVDFPRGPLEWFQILYSLAQNKQVVDQFHQTQFAEHSPLLDRLDVRLILYYPPLELPGVPLSLIPRDRLHAIPLTASETKVARSYGIMRVISHLGCSERYFPVMPWIDQDRGDCVTMEQMKGSVREEIPSHSFVGISCVQRGAEFTIHIPPSAENELKILVDALPSSDVLSLDCFPYEKSDSGMMWHQGITPRAYGNGFSCMNFGFVLFCPQNDSDELDREEDGIMVYLTESTWMRLCKAILQQAPLQITLARNLKLSLEYASHPSQPLESTEFVSESNTSSFSFGGRPSQWALDLVGDVPVPNPPSYKIRLESLSPGDCGFQARLISHMNGLVQDGIKMRKPLVVSRSELMTDKDKGCDRCDILYRAIKAHLPFLNQDDDVVLQFATNDFGLICAVKSQKGLSLVLKFSTSDEKCHWLKPFNNLPPPTEISADRLAEIQKWIGLCRSSHSECISACQIDPPKRLLDLGTFNQNMARIRLCRPKNSRVQYSTLSHCWIIEDTIATTMARLHEYTTYGIELSRVPQSIRAAVQILRHLGIQYLWVDSFCIVQDDYNDWKSETLRTMQIYGSSDLTIAVSGSVGCAEGCFLSEKAKYPVKKLRWPGAAGQGSYVVDSAYSPIHTPFYEGMEREQHLTLLHRTSSVHQERLFSRRILYTGVEEFVYRCRQTCQCECGYQITY